MEITEVILFNDICIILFRQFQQFSLFLHGIGNARRCLKIRHHINEFRLIQFQIILQFHHIHAIGFQRHFHQFCPTGKERPCRTVKRRLFHKNHIAIMDHYLRNDIDALLRAGKDLHIFHRGLNAIAFQIAAKLFSQWFITHPIHITEGTALFPLQHFIKSLLKSVYRKHFMRQRGAGKIDGILHGKFTAKRTDIAVCHGLRDMLHRQR